VKVNRYLVRPATLAAVGPRLALVAILRIYQLVLSPLLGQRCKYYPSCSEYAVRALRRWGAARGTALAVWRVLRCNPWSRGGVDHIPGEEPLISVDDDVFPKSDTRMEYMSS
jgi:putative membrane protein insertion efficiency factor